MPSKIRGKPKTGYYKRAGGAYELESGHYRKVGAGNGSYSKRSPTADAKRVSKAKTRSKVTGDGRTRAERYPQAYDSPSEARRAGGRKGRATQKKRATRRK